MKKSWVLFSRDLTQMSTEFFQEAMPVGKSWKKSRHSGTMKYLFINKLLFTDNLVLSTELIMRIEIRKLTMLRRRAST